MAILRKVKENLKLVSNIGEITRIYQEIANLRMKKIQQNVLDNREFIEELSQIYSLVKAPYRAESKKTWLKRKEFLRKTKGRVVVFLSANERFYGTLILNIWREVLNYLAKKEAVLAVVGKMGKYLAERSSLSCKVYYFELDDEHPEKERVKEIVDFVKNYEEVVIFHGKFRTILSQKVVQSNISGEVGVEKGLAKGKNYLFEPSPEAVLEFFESELILAFFNQALLEHQLSRYATRVIAMHQASEKAREGKRKLAIEEKKLKLQLLNKKQIELFSAVQLWS